LWHYCRRAKRVVPGEGILYGSCEQKGLTASEVECSLGGKLS
jgi:hypothetical protein